MPSRAKQRTETRPEGRLVVGGLFAGIGGIERGFERAGLRTAFLCERDEHAQAVLRKRFPGTPIHPDVCELAKRVDSLPDIDVLVGGFPCQDLSQAGRTRGIHGERSGLVSYMLELMEAFDRREHPPKWLVFENVANMLRLDGGAAMDYLTRTLQELGYSWAYRLVDTLSFGIPQRRHRVLMVASKYDDPRRVLFSEDAGAPPSTSEWQSAGFYWTEGLRGLGWAEDAVPTLKGGSALGIPSPPAIWTRYYTGQGGPDEDVPEFGTIRIEDGERLQGFPEGWTDVELPDGRPMPRGSRWRMVGNAVTVEVAAWLGRNLARPTDPVCKIWPRFAFESWPDAACSSGPEVFEVDASKWPVARSLEPLVDFLKFGLEPLSLKAVMGFRERTLRAKLNFPDEFVEALNRYIEQSGGSLEAVTELSLRRERAAAERGRQTAAARGEPRIAS